jgi:serine O-acetyltransferase
MDDSDLRALYEAHSAADPAPAPAAVRAWVDDLLGLLFHQLARSRPASFDDFRGRWRASLALLVDLLEPLRDALPAAPSEVADGFAAALPALRETLLRDAEAIYEGDPAAVDHDEVIRSYPGFFAIAVYRIAHHFHGRDVPVIPRVLTEYAHARTGIDIHPGAVIGQRFCIDHGTGIVIGETSEIGDNVKLYQGVTLGALSVDKELARTKRHPTVEDDVVVYASTTILGGDTVVGRGSVIGGNVWLLRSVPPHSRVHYAPGTVADEATDETAATGETGESPRA